MKLVSDPSPDVVIVGGGVIGLSIAYFLSQAGAQVTVLDQFQPGQEASWAGAGMLPPGNLDGAQSPAARLRAYSHQAWASLSCSLKEQTGIDNGYMNSGGLEIGASDDATRLQRELSDWRTEGVEVEELTATAIQECESAISREIQFGYRLAQFSQVRNPRHLKALLSACTGCGVKIESGAPVYGFTLSNGTTETRKVLAAKTAGKEYRASRFVIAGGAWTQGLLETLGVPNVPIQPVRGQIVLLSSPQLPFRHVINHGPRYLVPRSDGRILVGATEEWVGFEKTNTVNGVKGLLEFAVNLVPCLAKAKLERTWAGLRPGSPSGNPFLGPIPGLENGYVAAGHFRAGLQLSPGTGQLMAQLVTGQSPEIDLTPFHIPASQRTGD